MKKHQAEKAEIPPATDEQARDYIESQKASTNEDAKAGAPKGALALALEGVTVGPPTPGAIAERAMRMARSAHLRSPQERAAQDEARRVAAAALRQSEVATVDALGQMPESVRLEFLHALMSVEELESKPERSLSDTDRKELREAAELVQSMKDWPAAAQESYRSGEPRAENPELKLGFSAWKKARDRDLERARLVAREEHRERVRKFFQGTVPLHEALKDGCGLVGVWVAYTIMKKVGDRRIPVVDDNGKLVTGSGLVKISVEGNCGTIVAKMDDRRPPHIHPDPERRTPLHPEAEFLTPLGQHSWQEDVRAALVKAFAEGKERAARDEARRKVAEEISANLTPGTVTVTELLAGLKGEEGGKKMGSVCINNPALLRDLRNREGRFHLAFSLSVGDDGAAELGEYWYSSEHGAANLSPLVGYQLRLGLDENGMLRVIDPEYKNLDREDQKLVSQACGRVTGALRAQVSFEKKQAQARSAELSSAQASPASELSSAGVPDGEDEGDSQE